MEITFSINPDEGSENSVELAEDENIQDENSLPSKSQVVPLSDSSTTDELANGQTVTPWAVAADAETGIDYDKLM